MITGELDRTVVELRDWIGSHYFGKYAGKVDQVGSGDKLGLVRAIVPAVFGPETPSPWARPCVPFAGSKHGFLAIPEKDDLVWIEFEGGSRERPIWTGFLWAKDEMPDPKGTVTRAWTTSAGHQLVLDDDGDKVVLRHGDGPSIELTADSIALKVGGKKIEISKQRVSVNDGALEVT